MQIKFQPMGIYQTNCYIVTIGNKEIVIDPGKGATNWVLENVENPIAILNTHGHFDHAWSNQELKEKLKIPIYIPKDDAFMLERDPLNQGTPPSKADICVEPDSTMTIEDIKIKFLHFPGHTPGCSVIEIDDVWFSGDFLFRSSIGRWDFRYSNAKAMQKSLEKVAKIQKNYKIYPGHGEATTLKEELRYNAYWINQVQNSL
ncbi:MAG: MBL fold metallo-hydrolase [Campylobacterales bacterium]|nr:MBL fold metallo-hydrolase [Campylobacterales bacterium]